VKFKVLSGLTTAVGTAVILALGGREVLAGRMTVGSLLVFITYLASFYAPIETLTYTASTIQSAAGSARRVLEIFETEHDVKDAPGVVPLSSFGPVKGSITLDKVTFGYEPHRPVLTDVSLEIQPGQTVAIVGATGAGKSTLAGLVPRFFDPWSGRVLLDGREMCTLRLADLRRNVSLVLQDPFLFPRTVAENIAYGRPGASVAEIEAAAAAANAAEFIERLPQRYDTIIGERGATLSGGQRQRLSIARALLRNAPILVLDEPTSALDAGTETLLLSALERLTAGKTCLIIAHRLSTIRHADLIVVLEHGRIVERGNHEQLVAAGGLYAKMHRQFVGGSAEAGEEFNSPLESPP
jgi:ATP-binding cassette subfamily B protein/subfamily B ATP-binding cassette protein MsbA